MYSIFIPILKQRLKIMRNVFDKKLNSILSLALVVLSVIITVQTVFAGGTISAGESSDDTQQVMANVNPNYEQLIASFDQIMPTKASEPTEPPTTQPATQASAKPSTAATKKISSTAATTQATTEASSSIVWATAIPPKVPADYNAQWAAGYLIAIDNPDLTYECAQVTLCDEDRDLLERLCMGEFGTGGFIGAALIAQAVKNAMCFDGYTSVQAIIDGYHYTGRTDIPASDVCKQAVTYIFDQNHDAVQHRLLYMYNPYLVQSAFHESQNYILTYGGVRFFDRWKY